MTEFTSVRAAASFPAYQAHGGGALCVAYGHWDVSVEPVPADIYNMCKVPAGAVILGGFLRGEAIDGHADADTIDLDVGYAANGAVVADPDAFGNFGVRTGDAVTDVLPEGGVLLNLHGTLKDGPVAFTAETKITVTFVDDAATFAAGTVTVVVFYVCP